ncbi:hypothetical protein [Cellulomonas sp. Leaf334]|uniref:hypothetical protein n=1 Tax=Cellulomonas sp. Leaf334 TaxID=1736339 RepID=UPI0006F8CA23|nr:hypothetical protein [Cellulomonas sp. Leaf334]KQR16014.1 hypothetical protein ASF78_00795 [Cellulomonas sp. Leaf334]
MTQSTGILCLGTRPDASTWEKGCKSLGFDVPLPIKKPAPTMDELVGFFGRSFDWVFFGGHFASRRLYNESGDVGVRFGPDAVTLEVGSDTKTLKRGSAELGLRPTLVLWGGCSTLGDNDLVRDLHTLFGAGTMLGFRGVTGWKVVDAMLGAGFMADKQHFLARVQADSSSAELTAAWMAAAKLGWGGGKLEDRFAAVDTGGQRWILRDKAIVADSKLF